MPFPHQTRRRYELISLLRSGCPKGSAFNLQEIIQSAAKYSSFNWIGYLKKYIYISIELTVPE